MRSIKTKVDQGLATAVSRHLTINYRPGWAVTEIVRWSVQSEQEELARAIRRKLRQATK